ncbi:HNH endonuclease signature motif containing protein [Litchfieldia alkalitelluris]|uniref:HNH endonuclease signature motif containing protein n=1 Tax=Litchfieldia alkalitelluris TaxID=304268 RepID=UPI0009982181|nr:HNH endonuclease signature motif containing protein [Litchfieldia alkalitelluris]
MESAQELLDAGFSKTKTAEMIGVHHSKICRLVDIGELEIYLPFDDGDDKHQSKDLYEWLWEEDELEALLWKGYDEGKVDINAVLGERYYSVGRYVQNNYKNFHLFLAQKGFLPLEDNFFKTCSTCGESKQLKNFSKRKGEFVFGLEPQCNRCVEGRVRNNLINNESYKDRCKVVGKKWRDRNKDKLYVYGHIRRARESNLLNDLTTEQLEITKLSFSGCALTGDKTYHMDHVIPLAIGHGGTTYGNMIPLRSDLNISKHCNNIFEWFEANRQRFELSQERFDTLIDWLASANAMTVKEYREYVYWCHANPCDVNDKGVI